MLAYPVSMLVNNPKNDVPQCVEAIWRFMTQGEANKTS